MAEQSDISAPLRKPAPSGASALIHQMSLRFLCARSHCLNQKGITYLITHDEAILQLERSLQRGSPVNIVGFITELCFTRQSCCRPQPVFA